MSDDTEPLCDSCGCAECEVDDNGLNQTPYGTLCDSCHWTHILIDLRDAKAEITALRQRAERAEAALQWQPIKTAPRDGTEVLTCNQDRHIYLDWRDDTSNFPFNRKWYGNPTHWMPLPLAQAADAAEGNANDGK